MEKKNIVFNPDSLEVSLRDAYESDSATVCIISFEDVFNDLPEVIKTPAMVAVVQKLTLDGFRKLSSLNIIRDRIHVPLPVSVLHEKRLECSESTRALLLSPVQHLGLSSRTYNCLIAMKCELVYEVLINSPEDFLKVRNFGQKTLADLVRALEKKNITIDIGQQIRKRLSELESTILGDDPELMEKSEVRQFLDLTKSVKDLSRKKLSDYYRLSGYPFNFIKEMRREMFPWRTNSHPNSPEKTPYEKLPEAGKIEELLSQLSHLVCEYLERHIENFIRG